MFFFLFLSSSSRCHKSGITLGTNGWKRPPSRAGPIRPFFSPTYWTSNEKRKWIILPKKGKIDFGHLWWSWFLKPVMKSNSAACLSYWVLIWNAVRRTGPPRKAIAYMSAPGVNNWFWQPPIPSHTLTSDTWTLDSQ